MADRYADLLAALDDGPTPGPTMTWQLPYVSAKAVRKAKDHRNACAAKEVS